MVGGGESSGSLRRVSSMRKTFTSAGGGLKKRSVALQVKFQAVTLLCPKLSSCLIFFETTSTYCYVLFYLQDTLMDTLRRTNISVVHCLLPQSNAGLADLRASQLAPNQMVSSEDLMLNVPLVRKQVRALQLIDAIRLHRQGEGTL